MNDEFIVTRRIHNDVPLSLLNSYIPDRTALNIITIGIQKNE